MADNTDQIQSLVNKLEIIMRRQETFAVDIYNLQIEINRLRAGDTTTAFEAKKEIPIAPIATPIKKETEALPPFFVAAPPFIAKEQRTTPKAPATPFLKSNIEKFIGENLINKIGIAITLIGVIIGAKYSIEHQLISPLTRIILGYLLGAGLLGFGIKLKTKYEKYSAVLVSGAVAIFYFITYSAYAFYQLLPQVLTFALMVIFTIFAVIAALNYNMQVIALIGLVGAYAVPFLLSDGSGRVAILFSYVAIINCGILFIAMKKYWKPLYYSSYVFTWLIYSGWFITGYHMSEHFSLALLFLCIFFATFYCMFLGYKLIKQEKFGKQDIVFLLSNSFIFYGLGYAILNGHETGKQLLGVFTLCNAVIHFCVSTIIYKKKLADKNLFFLIAGLVLVFITITIPVQLDGHWVTMLWAGEAALLFWIGRTKKVPVYEGLSYPLILLAFISLLMDWSRLFNYEFYRISNTFIPLFNIHFLSSLIVISSFGFINYINATVSKTLPPITTKKDASVFFNIAIAALLLVVIYFAFEVEISIYFDQQYMKSELIGIKDAVTGNINDYHDYDINRFKMIWILNYSALFSIILSVVNIKKIKHQQLGFLNIIANLLVICILFAQGTFILKELREHYLSQELAVYYNRSAFHIGIRYICFGFLALVIVSIYKYLKQEFMKPLWEYSKIGFDILLYLCIIWTASLELINWMDVMGSDKSYKLGLSILWGIYALLLIGLGIAKKKKHLRIGAIVLFAITLLKLFIYDIAHLNTIAKTVVFVSLGVLLLIISFLYNKYKHLIDDEHKN